MMIYEHLEHYLGPILQGWGTDENDLNIEVSLFREPDKQGINTFSTLGLNKRVLPMGGKAVRQEFIFAAYERYLVDDVSSFLMTFAEYIAKKSIGLLRGDFIEGPALIEGASVTGVYASIPVFWPEGIQVFENTSPHTVLVWLIPITHSEAVVIREKGWQYFEKLLEKSDCDFWDLNRNTVM